MDEIIAIEDIGAFWKNLGTRNKVYKVHIGNETYHNMTLTYEKNSHGEECFRFRKLEK